MRTLSEYRVKLFSVLGDSVSTFEGCSEPEYAVYYDISHKLSAGILNTLDTWWGQVIQRLGGKLLVNNSFSGSTVCWHPLYEIQSYGCSDERTSSLGRDGVSPDVIMIYLGTNDWGCGTRVFQDERYDPVADNPALFLPAYRQMLKKLRTNYPNAEIWCFTLSVSQCSAQSDFSFPYCYGGRHISEYCDAIRLCAAEYGCRVIDLYNGSDPYDTLDGFHPTAGGMKTIADAVINELTKYET
ncbi:MAG: hypothetical protein E7448_08115 [Ruminococcaceae bacterium]|nr:hypothetical protein [Oscillospiraceae bacterium]